MHTTLVLGTRGGGRLRSIGVEFIDSNKRERGWQVATAPVPVADWSGVTQVGWCPYCGRLMPSQSKFALVLETGSQGEMIIEQIAILPTGCPVAQDARGCAGQHSGCCDQRLLVTLKSP